MAEVEAAAPPAPPPAAAAAGLIADSAARFLAGAAAGAEKSELAAASLGSLVGFDTSQLQATIGFLVECVRVLAGAQSIAIDVSRAPTFRRRFGEVMEAVSAGGSFGGSE